MADSIRVLVATDNHVGYNERDPVRGDDSWKSFHEIMCLAKQKDVDMVLLAGDLFHENKPSRKSMYNVMRSLRMNCYGEKPCELELLSDGFEHFNNTFSHANYEDPDINVGIPVFSIHGNHDDPSGEGHLAALDILEMAGLINYFGRTPESDNINVRPVLIQKGRTKLALYGLSNVRDERLYRTFRDGKVKFFKPGTQTEDWFNVICVHQNHHAHTETNYLPEHFLPNFLDLVIWGHEHECDIEPHINPVMNFRVMQPGSSVATSLIASESQPKHVALLTITGREFRSESIRLKSVRPFIFEDLILSLEKEAIKIAQKDNHRTLLTQFLQKAVNKLIDQAKQEWQEAQEEAAASNPDNEEEPEEFPLPLIRLRVDTTSADGVGKFEVENPQRFSNRFIGQVANHNDVIQFIARKKGTTTRRNAEDQKLDQEIMAKFDESTEVIKVSKLVQEFLAAQSLTILPQNFFGDAVNQFVDKDDRHAMEMFVNDSLANQIKHLVQLHEAEGYEVDADQDLSAQIDTFRSQMEDMFAQGRLKNKSNETKKYRPKPSGWDTDLDGEWEDQPAATVRANNDDEDEGFLEDEDEDVVTPPAATRTTARGRGRGRGGATTVRGARGSTTVRGRGATSTARTKKPAAATITTSTRTRQKANTTFTDEESEEDVIMLDHDSEDEESTTNNNHDDDDDDDEAEEDSQAMFFQDKSARGSRASTATTTSTPAAPARGNTRATRTTTTAKATAKKPVARSAAAAAAARLNKQATLNFSASQAGVLAGEGRNTSRLTKGARTDVISDDDEDEDAFEPVKPGSNSRGASSRRK